ncbi:MAG: hypothetical protein ACYSUV_02135, partial [Planctomycetota bacterium]
MPSSHANDQKEKKYWEQCWMAVIRHLQTKFPNAYSHTEEDDSSKRAVNLDDEGRQRAVILEVGYQPLFLVETYRPGDTEGYEFIFGDYGPLKDDEEEEEDPTNYEFTFFVNGNTMQVERSELNRLVAHVNKYWRTPKAKHDVATSLDKFLSRHVGEADKEPDEVATRRILDNFAAELEDELGVAVRYEDPTRMEPPYQLHIPILGKN